MAGIGIELKGHILHPLVHESPVGPEDAFAVLPHRVGGAGDEQHRQIFRHAVEIALIIQPPDEREQCLESIDGEQISAQRVGNILLYVFIVVVLSMDWRKL